MTEKKFTKKLITYNCKFFVQCYDDDDYDMSDCMDDYEDYIDDYSDYYEECKFDKGAAKKCLKGYKIVTRADCDDDDDLEDAYDKAEDFLNDCDDVFDCSDVDFGDDDDDYTSYDPTYTSER